MFTFERCSLFMIYHKYCVTEWEEFGTEKKCSYFGVVHFLEVFTFGGFTVLNQGWLRIYTKYNIIKFTANNFRTHCVFNFIIIYNNLNMSPMIIRELETIYKGMCTFHVIEIRFNAIRLGL